MYDCGLVYSVIMSSVKKIYLNPRASASFTGKAKFIQNHKSKDRKKVSEELDSIKAYYLHAPAPKKYPRRKIITLYPGFLWAADLINLVTLEKSNRSFRYILVVIDVFTK